MKLPDRTFTTESADMAAGPIPLWIAAMGPSGGGKTYSMLRVAKGVQSVTGGDIHMIDTEGGRGRHYKDYFKYQYTAFPPPHGSLDYLVAIKQVRAKGARIIIIDSMSHEHDGEGGMIEFQEAEVTRMAANDYAKRQAVAMLAWGQPKAARKRLLAGMIGMPDVTFLLGFRANDQSKPIKNEKTGKNEVVHMGFMPIAGREFVYECTVSALLLPGANGVPTWTPEFTGEKMMRKLPRQFAQMFGDGQPLSEEHGRLMAEWARGSALGPAVVDPVDRVAKLTSALKAAATPDKLASVWRLAAGLRAELQPDTLADLTLLMEAREAELAELNKESA